MTTNIQSFAGDVQIDSGNLSVKSLEVKDGVTKLGSNNTAYSNVGVMMTRKDGASNVAFLFTEDGANVVLGYTNDDALEGDRIDILTDEKANLVVYGNVYVTGSVHGDGSTLTGLVTTLQSVTEFGADTDQTILFTNEITGINVSSNVLVSGNVTANVYYGDGGLLANITQTLEGITAIGNTTPYTLEFNNTDTSFVTVSNVGIGNALPTADLCVGSNVVIDDERLNKINVVGNVACHQLNLGSVEILPAYSLENVTQISNTTTNTMSFNNSTLAFDTQKMAGIGIIPSSADVGVSGLHVDGHLRLGGEAENTDEEQMYIKAAGALGVLANESDTNNTNTELRLQSGDTNNSNITMVGKSSAQYMTFGTNAAERMRIDSSGNVGIGTNNPVGVNGGNRLEGSSATGFEFISSRADNTTEIDDFIGAYLFKNTDTDGNAPHYCGMSAKGATTNGAMSLYFHSQRDKYELGNTPDLFIDTNGRVGVGTDDPDYTLDVVGTGGFSSNLTVGTANLHVDTTTGNVGIGTTSPEYTLDVSGTVNTGALTATSGSFRSGGVAATFEGTHSLGLISIITAKPTDGTGYNASSPYNLNAIYRADTNGATSDAWKAFSANRDGVNNFYVQNTGNAYFAGNVGIGTGNPDHKLDVHGRVDSERYLTSNTFPLPDPNQHSFRHVCMITNTSVPYGLTQPGGCIYEYNPLTGDTVRVVEPVSEPTAGTFEATVGREYFPMGSPMTIVREHRIAPFTNLGSLFGFVESRYDATTAYLYAPYSNVSVEYFHDTSVTGTPTSTIVVPCKTVVSFTCTSASGTNSHVFVAKGGRILMSSTGNGGDTRVLAPLSTIAYGYDSVNLSNDVYLEDNVTISGKCVYSNQNVPLILSQGGDGDGGDGTCGIPFELVADTYIVPHDIRGWEFQFLYTETIVNVSYWSATNSQWEQYGTYSPSGTPSILSPEELQVGQMAGTGSDIGTSHTLWMFTGTKDFTLTVEEYTDLERTVSGFRAHQVAQQIQTNLLDNVVQDSSGNVGIGTTNPTSNLHVVGDINLTSNIVMSGQVFVKAHDASKNYVAVGRSAGQTSQGTNAVAVGYEAGKTEQGVSAVAVGYLAGQTNQHDNTVVLNASGSALNTEGTGRTYIKPLRVATVASNVMTYDQTTGEVMDSGGLISNKFAIVSEQPPSALTGATTTIQGHGRYKVTSSSMVGSNYDYNIFSKNETDTWISFTDTFNVDGTYAGSESLGGVSGEWVKLEMPYKTTLRHFTLRHDIDNTVSGQLRQFPVDFKIVASNDDTNWQTLNTTTGVSTPEASDPALTFVVNASASYKFYAIVVEKITSGANFERCHIGELRLFTESFSVDGGIVSTTAASGLETGFTEHPVAPMTGFNTYVEGHGTYEVSASNFTSGHEPWEAYTNIQGDPRWITNTNGYNSDGTYTGSVVSTDIGGTRYSGEWNQLKFPYAQTISHIDLYATGGVGIERAPTVGVILGSNDGEHWYKLTEFSGKTYIVNIATRIDVNATLSYMYVRLVCTNVGTSPSEGRCELNQIHYFSATGVTKMDNVLISGELAVDGGALQTSHIKWPKVPLKANESEGYVASASSDNGSVGLPYHAFEDKGEYSTSSSPVWSSTLDTFSGGVPINGTAASFDGNDCEWLQIQMPRSIQLSYFLIYIREYNSQKLVEGPKSGFMYGSNDGVVWTKLVSYDNLVHVVREGTRVDVQSTEAYKYFRLVVTSTVGTPTHNGVVIDELQLFESTLGVGTSATTAKLTVDGGLGLAKGSQVFAGSDVVTEFPKHDRPLTKYPEVLFMEGEFEGNDSTNTYTQAGYTVTANSTHENRNHEPWKIFDGTQNNEWQISTQQGGDRYSESTGTYNTGVDLAGVTVADQTYNGDWVQVSLPKKIKVDHMNLGTPVTYGDSRMPEKGVLLGSNNGSNWSNVASFGQTSYPDGSFTRININSAEYYSYYRMIWLKLTAGNDSTHRDRAALSEWELYGYEEGDESVDIVHKSIPNKPSQQQLAVYYEARDPNSYSFADSSNVYDLSGSGVTGTITGNNGFDAEYNAWVFDGSGDYISGTLNNATGFGNFSMSFWLNSAVLDGVPVSLGTSDATGKRVTTTIRSDGSIRIAISSNYVSSAPVISVNQWYHIAINLSTATISTSSYELYLNGLKLNFTTNLLNGGAISLNANERLVLGADSVSFTSGFTGSIANFRLYSKALNADQVRELYEYDAERFGHRQNLVALHKGNLGVGVTNPTSRFEVAGADGLQEFPPKAMTGYETYIPGHGVFRAYANSEQNGAAWKAFNKTDATGEGWITDIDEFVADTGYSNTSTATTNTIFGRCSFLAIETPGLIKLEKIRIQPDVNTTGAPDLVKLGMPKDFQIWARKGGTEWTQIAGYTDQIFLYLTGSTEYYDVNVNDYYSEFAIVVTRTHTSSSYSWTSGTSQYTRGSIGEWRLFGTPAPSSLEDGHLTLGKALTLPRVSGHPAGAETPRAESLVVHYDTTVDSVVSGSMVVDISGEGNNGTLYGNTSYSSSTRSFDFDGLGADYVLKSSPSGLPTGDAIYSMSAWINTDSSIGSAGIIISFGSSWTSNNIASMYIRTGNQLGASTGGNLVYTTNAVLSYNTWHHVAITKKSTGAISTAMFDLYVDGTLITATTVSGTGTQNLGTITGVSVGMSFDGSSNEFHGKISKPKLWNVALTAEEVSQEYALGRTGKSLNLTDTAFCLGGTVPRAQLDVRGSALVAGNLEIVGSLAATDIEASSFITERVILKESWPNASLVGNLGTWENSNLTGPSYGATPDGYRTLEFTNPNDTGFLTSGTFDLRKYALVDGSFASDTQTKTSTRVFLKAWINTDSLDNNDTDAHLYIEFSPDNGTTWHKVYRDDSNEDLGTDAGWKMAVADLSPYIDATTSTQCKIRFHCAAIGSADFYKFGQIFIYESGVPTNLGGMWLGAGGKIGIGTNDPAYKLDVHGTSNVGALTATSVTQTTPVIYKAYLVNGTGINVNASVTYTEYAIFDTGYTESINSGSFTLSGTTKVVAPSTGYYRLSFNICFLGSGGQRTNIGVKPVIEGTELDEYSGSNYIRYANAHNEATTNMTTLIHLTGNREVGLAFARLTDITNAVYIDPGSYIILEKI
jgi:hypothetical protein